MKHENSSLLLFLVAPTRTPLHEAHRVTLPLFTVPTAVPDRPHFVNPMFRVCSVETVSLRLMRTDNVPPQVQVSLERFLTDRTLHVRRIVDQFHVLAQVRQVAVDATAFATRSRVQRVKLACVSACNKLILFYRSVAGTVKLPRWPTNRHHKNKW